MEEPALAIMVPLLERGLRERQTAIKRKTAIIIDNMCKLVEDPSAAAPFLPKLLPGACQRWTVHCASTHLTRFPDASHAGLEKLAAEVSDPEARQVCGKAQATLLQAAGGKEAAELIPKKADEAVILSMLREAVAKKATVDEFVEETLAYVTSLCVFLSDRKFFISKEWIEEAVAPYLAAFVPAELAEEAARALLARCVEDTRVEKKKQEDDDEARTPWLRAWEWCPTQAHACRVSLSANISSAPTPGARARTCATASSASRTAARSCSTTPTCG